MTPSLIRGIDFSPATEGDEANGLRCHAGHDTHAMRRVVVPLRGQNVVSEYPAIPARLATDLTLGVYEWERYAGFRGYCTGQDESSHALSIGQVWEGYETILALAILAAGDRNDAVLDFGAHLGWYACIAGRAGYPVVAFEADPENAAACAANAALNGCADRVHVINTWIDHNTPAIPATAERVRLLKSDMEGMEHQVVRMCGALFDSGLIDFALLEMSPIFVRNARHPGWETFGGYDGLARWICARGYDAFEIPCKGARPAVKAAFEADPLKAIAAHQVAESQLAKRLGSTDQANYLFARRGLV